MTDSDGAPPRVAPPSCLTRLRGGSPDRIPVLVLHGMQCDPSFAMMLARAMPRDQPVYGFWAPGLTGAEPPLASIDAMADRYLAEAAPIVAGGPVLLVGFCAGATIAKQMAHRARPTFGSIVCLLIVDTARITREAGFADIARNQIQIARHRLSKRPVEGARFAGAGVTVAAFMRALVHWGRSGRLPPYTGRSIIIATKQSFASMTSARTGWRGALPADTVVAIEGEDRAAMIGERLPAIARRIYALSARA